MINAYIITIKGNERSHRAASRLNDSMPSNIFYNTFDAIVPDQVERIMKKYKLKWTWPWEKEEFNIKAGLVMRPYVTADPQKRIGCFLSHYMLWQRCVKHDEAIIIHEHDSIYFSNENLPIHELEKSWYNIIGLNSPAGATRLASGYDRLVQESEGKIVKAPAIDDHHVPQGIAGNSSYYIKPKGAQIMIDLTKEYGCWPNDALMCRQLVSTLGQTKHYYTGVQGIESTTTK